MAVVVAMFVEPSEPDLADHLSRAGFDVVIEHVEPPAAVDPRWDVVVCDRASALGLLETPGPSLVVVAPTIDPVEAVALIRRGVLDVIASTTQLAVVLECRLRDLRSARLLIQQLGHELNNPLTALSLSLELATDQVAALDHRNVVPRPLDRERCIEIESLLEDSRRATERLTRVVAALYERMPAPVVPPALKLVAPTELRKGRILIVEDEPALGRVLRRILSDHDVEVVEDGQIALSKILEGERFDVILCDIMMPNMTGIELHAALSRSEPAQASKLAFMTGGTFTKEALEFLGTVRYPVLAKPFVAERVRSLVQTLLLDGS